MKALHEQVRAAAASGITFHRAKTNDIDMHYARTGKGQPLILLHGGPEFWLS